MSELISPELALVDPELAARARAALPDPGTLHLSVSVSSRPVVRSAPPGVVADSPAAAQPTPRSRRLTLVPAVATVVAVLCASPFIAWQIRSGASEISSGSSGIAAAERVRPSGTTFTWPRIQSAESYRLDVRNAANVVFTIRTSATKAALPIRPALPRGTYSWRVAPLFDLKSVANVGAPIVEGVFTVGQ